MVTLCATPVCSETVEPYATDGGDFYRTEDEGGRCASCNHSRECACCGDRFECDDPSDPDNTQCPECAADVVPVTCDHTNSTCATCERH